MFGTEWELSGFPCATGCNKRGTESCQRRKMRARFADAESRRVGMRREKLPGDHMLETKQMPHVLSVTLFAQLRQRDSPNFQRKMRRVGL